MKVGMALGSGGARGLAHVGVLKALKELDIPIDYVSGSSMGALVGAIYSSSVSIDPLESLADEFNWRKMLKLFLPTLSKEGLIDGDKIVELLENNLEYRKFSELQMPFAVETTDIQTGNLHTITQGDLVDAVRASISIPLIFTPVRRDGKILVDGGLVSPVPVKSVRSLGADFIIGVNVLAKSRSWMSSDKMHKQFQSGKSNILSRLFQQSSGKETEDERKQSNLNFVMILTQTIGTSVSKLADFQLQVEQPDIVIEPDTSSINIYDFHRGGELIDSAYEMTIEIIRDNQGLLKEKGLM